MWASELSALVNAWFLLFKSKDFYRLISPLLVQIEHIVVMLSVGRNVRIIFTKRKSIFIYMLNTDKSS